MLELYVNITKEARIGLSPSPSEYVRALSQWPVVEMTPDVVLAALGLAERSMISPWDAAILEAAKQAGCSGLASNTLVLPFESLLPSEHPVRKNLPREVFTLVDPATSEKASRPFRTLWNLTPILVAAALGVYCLACQKPTVGPLLVTHVDRSILGPSKYPIAGDPALVGSFSGQTGSGAGYFFDEVLEYRVWLCTGDGAPELSGGDDYFAAFARYEAALEFSKRHTGAEEPLVLIRQREWVSEPEPGKFIWMKTERITEWQVKWLERLPRGPNSIPEFLSAHGTRAR